MKFNYPRAGSLVKDLHTMQILCSVRENLLVSRTDLCRQEGISKSTATRIVDELIREGYLVETGLIESSSSKRKPIGLRLNADRFCCIGVNVTQSSLHTILTDFEACSLLETHTVLQSPSTPEDLYAAIESAIRNALGAADKSEDQVLGVGIGLPGLVNSRTGEVVNYASEGKLTALPLKMEMESRFPFPVFIDNNVNCLILSEKMFTRGENVSNCLFVSCWDGIGGAAIVDETLLAGSTNAVGEVGHTIVVPNGKRCRCGNFGCAEAYCLPESLCAAVKEGISRGRASALKIDDLFNVENIMTEYESGDRLCAEHVTSLAQKLSICLANASNILNPDTIILAGPLFEMSDQFFSLVQELTREKLLSRSSCLMFIKRTTKDRSFRLGSASLVFDAFFQRQ